MSYQINITCKNGLVELARRPSRVVGHIGMSYAMSNMSAIDMTAHANNFEPVGYSTWGTKCMLAKHIDDGFGK